VNPLDWKTRARGVFLGRPPFTVGAFPLARAAEAHRAGESGRTPGKLVLTVA
jgi:hypothetical protein